MSFREVHLQAPAKINLDLRVLYKRPDGYHELRTVFQTISLADSLVLRYRPAKKLSVALTDGIHIADNIVIRAARLCCEEMRLGGEIECSLVKKVPMGAGLGGGSSDAAAVLLALPVLAGKAIPIVRLNQIAAQLGSDVPFFLYGGRAAGLGRGEELYPLPDVPRSFGVLVAPNVAVSTPAAYKALSAQLDKDHATAKLASFQAFAWSDPQRQVQNDFEAVVFAQHPKLKLIKSQLVRAGSTCASMTGSGSAIFGLFAGKAEASQACQLLARKFEGEHRVFPIRLMDRVSYRRLWRRQLLPYISPDNQTWPPQN